MMDRRDLTREEWIAELDAVVGERVLVTTRNLVSWSTNTGVLERDDQFGQYVVGTPGTHPGWLCVPSEFPERVVYHGHYGEDDGELDKIAVVIPSGLHWTSICLEPSE